jgi:C4-dicarboxylate-specific signal transduction histidine kinase
MTEKPENEAIPKTRLTDQTDAQLRLLAISARASTMVHELMQPLCAAVNYLRGGARKLEQEDCAPETIDIFKRSEALVMRAADIVRGMRAFVLDGAVRGRPTRLADILEAARSQLSAEQRLSGDVTVALARDAELVNVDPLQIELVLSNLLANAMEAAPPGATADVRIHSRRLDDFVVVTISDAGSGLTDQVHENLFEPLFTTKTSGSGLGLPICKVIVEAHGGQLWAAQPSLSGATFYMTLPAAVDRP